MHNLCASQTRREDCGRRCPVAILTCLCALIVSAIGCGPSMQPTTRPQELPTGEQTATESGEATRQAAPETVLYETNVAPRGDERPDEPPSDHESEAAEKPEKPTSSDGTEKPTTTPNSDESTGEDRPDERPAAENSEPQKSPNDQSDSDGDSQ